jgi:hypothetical protein
VTSRKRRSRSRRRSVLIPCRTPPIRMPPTTAIKGKGTKYSSPMDHTAKQRRIAARRREEATDVFRERYQIRGGIEGTNSGLKRRTGLGRLRVRGRPRVVHAIYLKVAGWNILRASVCTKMRELVYQRATMAVWRDGLMDVSTVLGRLGPLRGPALSSGPLRDALAGLFSLPAAA